MPNIDVSDSTYRRLLRRCVSFEDTAEEVVKRLLDETSGGPAAESGRSQPRSSQPQRAAPGSILPERAYWLPILGVIADGGGSVSATEVIEALPAQMKDSFAARDLEVLSMGEVRWRNRARFARLRMKEQGFLSDSSPRGIWEITEAGRRLLEAD